MVIKTSSLTVVLLSVIAGATSAQLQSDFMSYRPMIGTPVAGHPPIATNTILGLPGDGAAFAVRYGRVPSSNLSGTVDNVAATASFAAGTASTVSLTAGMLSPTALPRTFMASVGADTRLVDIDAGDSQSARLVRLGASGEVGFGTPTGSKFVAASVGLPVSLIARESQGGDLLVVPFLTPGFGFGATYPNSGSSGSGAHFMLGGGVAISNHGGNVGLNVGFQHVAVDGGSTQFGAGVLVGLR
jgi:hypothetical protein